MEGLLPCNEISQWSGLQQHAARTFLQSNAKMIYYETKPQQGTSTMLLGLIASAMQQKIPKVIVLMVPTRAKARNCTQEIRAMCGSNIGDLLVYNSETLRTPTTTVHVQCLTRPLIRRDVPHWILVDAGVNTEAVYYMSYRENERLFITLSIESIKKELKFIANSCYPNVEVYYQDFPEETRRAIWTWLLCAPRLGVYKDVAFIIAKWIEATRTNPMWIDHDD